MVGGALAFAGPWQGRPILASRGDTVVKLYSYDIDAGRLRELPASAWPHGVLADMLGDPNRTPFHRADGVIQGELYSKVWRAASLGDGAFVLAKARRRDLLDANDNGEAPEDGGLYLVARDGTRRRISSEADGLPGDWVYDVLPDRSHRWVCTSGMRRRGGSARPRDRTWSRISAS